MRDKEKQAKEKLETHLRDWRAAREEKRVVVDEEDILHVVSKWTGIPLQRMEQGEMQRLLTVEAEMEKVVIGQREAVSAICKALRRSRADLKDPRRPIGTFLLLGPTGVGKTLLAKTLAEQMFGDAKSLIHLDMSEYMEKFNVSRLIGSPPGYVGYEEGGQLTEKVRRNPYSVVLFDEIEKAHPDVWNMLLQILEEGKLTDNVGRVVNFRNTIILMTSNVGSDMINRQSTLGFSPDHRREQLREDARENPGRSQEDLPARIPEPAGRRDCVPLVHQARPHPDSGSGSQQGFGAAAAQEPQARTGRQGEGFSGRKRLRPAIRRASDAPVGGAFPRRPAGRGNSQRATCTKASRSSSRSAKDKLVFNQKAAAAGAVAS